MSADTDQTSKALHLVRLLESWLTSIDAEYTGAAVDFADSINAGWHIERLVRHLLTLDPLIASDAREAQDVLGELHGWLFVELRHHLDDLEQSWDALEQRLKVFAPYEGDTVDNDVSEGTAST